MHSSTPEADLAHLGGPLPALRAAKLEMTQRLLGDTIQLEDVQWQEHSLLPGWTRAHVATHLARNADGFREAFESWQAGQPRRMYPSEADRERDVERGSQRTGLELQIDLDTSSSALQQTFNQLEGCDPDALVELRAGFRLPVRLLPLARLSEVVLHHIDLDIGFTALDVPEPTATWLLGWVMYRLEGRLDLPALLVTTPDGAEHRLGGFGTPRPVTGTAQELLGWLSGRSSEQGIAADVMLSLPLLG